MTPNIKLNLKTKPSNPTIIVGFPGFGLVGVIATEFLCNHTEAVEVGKYWFEQLPATIAVHDSKIVNPVGLFYDKKNNLVIIHSISAAPGLEWAASELIIEVADKVGAKEIICLDGVGISGTTTNVPTGSRVFFYAKDKKTKESLELSSLKPEALKESIILGVTPAVLLKSNIPVIALFSEVKSDLPDSKSAAKLIHVLNDYLKMNLNYKPLIEAGDKFEEKIKKIVDEHKKITENTTKKDLDYFG